VHVRRLQLTTYRNYRQLDLNLPTGRLLFLGENAKGKSNLLEAVYLLASGRSRRAGSDSELIAWQTESAAQPFARLQAAIDRQVGSVQLEALIAGAAPAGMPGAARGGRRFRVNGIPRRARDFVGQLRAVLFTADDLDLISGAPAGRRLYLDAALSQIDPTYYAALRRYGHITQQRNASLRRIKEGVAGADELSLWDEGFTREGATIIAGRLRAVTSIAPLAAGAHASLSGAAERLEMAYEPQLGEEWRALLPAESDATAVQPLFAAALAGQRRREIAAGLSLLGPHRDDVSLRLNGADAAAFGSRAQIRTAALALRLAEAQLLTQDGDPPVLLLDDIVSELDEHRRASVLEGIAGFGQAWFTATSGALLPAAFVATCRVFEVRDGEVVPA
jgi:DNA replication and repair protein RecF